MQRGLDDLIGHGHRPFSLGGFHCTDAAGEGIAGGASAGLFIAVGGGAKAYSGPEAAEVVRELQPRRVIPVQYQSGKPLQACDLTSAEPFLKAMAGTAVKRPGPSLSLTSPLSDAMVIELMR